MKNRIIICALIFVANLLTGGTDQPFGLLPTPPEFTFDYDWENDATYDLTDAGDSVCHTYTPGDSLWAKVKATTATYTAENSAEVIVPEGEEITIEPTLLFSIPIPAGDTVALGEPTEDGRFPVSFTFGGMNDGVIRIYDTTGAVVDSFPNAYGGRSFDISPNGNLVFLTECLCSDSLNDGFDDPRICQRLYTKEGILLFETLYCISCKFSKDGGKLGRPTINNVLEPTEWDVHSIMIIDTISNRILYFYLRDGFSIESKIYESSLSDKFTKIWKIGIDSLWIYDDEKNVLAEVPNFWGSIKPEGDIEWNYFINKVDNNESYWRIAPIGRPITTLLSVSYDTLGNQIRSLSLDFEDVQRLSCGISDEGNYLWATVYREQVDSCLIYSTDNDVEIIGFEIPISHEYDSLKRIREVSIESSRGFYLGNEKAIAISCIKELGNGREIIVTDMNGVLLLGLPKATNHYESKFESYKFTGDGKYLIAVRNETIFAYRIWR